MHRSRPGFIPHQLSTHSVPTVEVLLADSIMAGSLEVFTGVAISWAMVAVAPLPEPQEAADTVERKYQRCSQFNKHL